MGTLAAVSKCADRLVLFGVQTISAYGSNENARESRLEDLVTHERRPELRRRRNICSRCELSSYTFAPNVALRRTARRHVNFFYSCCRVA